MAVAQDPLGANATTPHHKRNTLAALNSDHSSSEDGTPSDVATFGASSSYNIAQPRPRGGRHLAVMNPDHLSGEDNTPTNSATFYSSSGDKSAQSHLPTIRAPRPLQPPPGHHDLSPPERIPSETIVIEVTHDAENYVAVDITGHTDAQAIRECILSELHIPHDLRVIFAIYRIELGEFDIGTALDDNQLLIECRQFGDGRGSLKFLAQPADAPTDDLNIPIILPASDLLVPEHLGGYEAGFDLPGSQNTSFRIQTYPPIQTLQRRAAARYGRSSSSPIVRRQVRHRSSGSAPSDIPPVAAFPQSQGLPSQSSPDHVSPSSPMPTTRPANERRRGVKTAPPVVIDNAYERNLALAEEERRREEEYKQWQANLDADLQQMRREWAKQHLNGTPPGEVAPEHDVNQPGGQSSPQGGYDQSYANQQQLAPQTQPSYPSQNQVSTNQNMQNHAIRPLPPTPPSGAMLPHTPRADYISQRQQASWLAGSGMGGYEQPEGSYRGAGITGRPQSPQPQSGAHGMGNLHDANSSQTPLPPIPTIQNLVRPISEVPSSESPLSATEAPPIVGQASPMAPAVGLGVKRYKKLLAGESGEVSGPLWQIPKQNSTPAMSTSSSSSTSLIPRTATHPTPKPPVVITRIMPESEVIAHLGDHGCDDITDQLDLTSSSAHPVFTGGFGDIYRANLLDGTQVAIKAVRLRLDSINESTKHLKNAARELYAWSKCDHPNVLKLLGLTRFRGQIGMVSMWMAHGNLPDYLSRTPDVDRCEISAQICEGIAYLHGNNFIHGDLKALNVLISSRGTPVLTDFGNAILNSRTLQFTATTKGISLSLRWAAPELFQEPYLHSIETDIYALGMETITGKVPYHGKNEPAIISAKFINKEPPTRPEDTIPSDSKRGNELWSLLLSCWSHEPNKRPSAREVAGVMKSIRSHHLRKQPPN